MSIIGWVVLCLVAGFIASKIVALGIAGAFVGGSVSNWLRNFRRTSSDVAS